MLRITSTTVTSSRASFRLRHQAELVPPTLLKRAGLKTSLSTGTYQHAASCCHPSIRKILAPMLLLCFEITACGSGMSGVLQKRLAHSFQ
ncbi:hypothetical protein, partial [Rhizobium oryziradicis]|uniref:hypothetical protein n=1 Tax=Rhizobium oryziradicis TaxID=1867956 RepID=UPI001AECD693